LKISTILTTFIYERIHSFNAKTKYVKKLVVISNQIGLSSSLKNIKTMTTLQYFIVFALTTIVNNSLFSHVGMRSDSGKLAQKESFIGEYTLELSLIKKDNLFVQNLSFDNFDTGIDNTSEIKVEIREDGISKAIWSQNFHNIHQETATINLSFLFLHSKIYTISIKSNTVNGDDFTDFFIPVAYPFSENSNTFSIENCFYIQEGSGLKTSLLKIPSVILETSFQSGINFIDEQKGTMYEDERFFQYHATEFTVKPSEKFLIVDSIGLNYYEVGKDQKGFLGIRIYDSSTRELISSQDSLLINIHKQKVKLPISCNFLPGKTYCIAVFVDNSIEKDGIILAFKPNQIPYDDNLNQITVNSFFKSSVDEFPTEKDSVGMVLNFDFKSEDLHHYVFQNKQIETPAQNKLYAVQKNNELTIELTQFDHFTSSPILNLLSLDNEKVEVQPRIDDSILSINTKKIKTGIYKVQLLIGSNLYENYYHIE
jgi:hypothetical protein